MDLGGIKGDHVTQVDRFLDSCGWADARHEPLAGDASSRRYIRLCSGATCAILMIDPQDDTDRFAAIAQHLLSIGLSAPQIIAHDKGLMLLEDFGDAQFAKVIASDSDMETPLYLAAADVLCRLETAPLPMGLKTANPIILGQMIEPAFAYYVPAFGGTPDATAQELTNRLTEGLSTHLTSENVLVLRDYHAENMIWLPERTDIKRVGLLDFQDALCGPPLYDLVSLLQDARRDVSANCQNTTIAHYLDSTGRSETDILPSYHLLGIQRNLRILGIFSRLALENGKPSYLSLIPRVWRHIQTSLDTPVAKNLRPLFQSIFPEPTKDRLNKVKTVCQTQ